MPQLGHAASLALIWTLLIPLLTSALIPLTLVRARRLTVWARRLTVAA
jgi:hypothetical protein